MTKRTLESYSKELRAKGRTKCWSPILRQRENDYSDETCRESEQNILTALYLSEFPEALSSSTEKLIINLFKDALNEELIDQTGEEGWDAVSLLNIIKCNAICETREMLTFYLKSNEGE